MNPTAATRRQTGCKNRFLVQGDMDKEVFDLQGAADYLKKSRRWLRENCVSLGIEHERIGRGFRFARRELDRFLAQHRRLGRRGVYVA